MRPADETVQKGIPVFVVRLIFDGNQSVLKIHDCVAQLEGVFGHVGGRPCLIRGLLLLLQLGLRMRAGDVLLSHFD